MFQPTKYWSSSAFASWLERLVKFPEMSAMGGTLDQWAQHEQSCRAINNTVYNFINWLNKLQAFVNLPATLAHSFRYNVACRLNRTHVLSTTRGKPGQWMDLTGKIPDALFTSIIGYVENECADMALRFGTADPIEVELNRMHLYGSLPQSLWFIANWWNRNHPVTRVVKMRLGRAWLTRYSTFSTEHGEDYSKWVEENTKILELYEFAKSYFHFDEWQLAANQLGYNPKLSITEIHDLLTVDKNRKRDFYNAVDAIEIAHEAEVDRYLKMIVELRHTLWT